MVKNEKQKAIIVDLDGTLCDVEHRVHHVQGPNKDWLQFNQLLVHDALNDWCFELIEAMVARNYKIIFVTGRGESNRLPTEEWLTRHSVAYEHLYMRALLDQREDADVKEDIYLQFIEPKYHISFVLDDRQSVVDRWRELKLVCLQCAPGNF
jgi:uncharacterized HAD superfamily protein